VSFSAAGGGPIATAFVEVTAKTRSAERQISLFLRGLETIDNTAKRVSNGLERAFETAFRSVDSRLRALGGPGLFDDIERQAELAGESITGSLVESGRQAEEQLRQIGGAGTFTGVEVQAEQAGEHITDSFAESQRQSDTQLGQIGGAGTFAPVVAQAEIAGERIERSFDEAARHSTRSLSLVRTALIGVGTAFGLVATAAVGFGIKQAATLEQTRIGFEALLGSAEEADSFIREMQQFAATTPFEFQGLAENARRLLAMGEAANISREDILPLLTTIGDLVSTLGAPPEAIDRVITALSQMASKGKVSTEELLQITEAVPGFPVFKAMADGLGISTAALQDQLQAGSIPALEGIEALITGMEKFPGAAGAMAKQSQTLIGLFSTFKDTLSLALVEAFDPLIPKVKSTLAEITPLLQTALTGIAPALAQITSTLLSGFVPVLAQIGPPLAGFLSGLAEGFSIFAHGLAPAIGTVANALSSLGPVMEILGTALQPIAAAFAELLNVILPPLITVFGQLVEVLGPVLTQVGSLATSFFQALAPSLSKLIEPLGRISQIFGDALLQILRSLEPDIPRLAEAFGELAIAVAELVIAFEPLFPIVAALISVLAKGLAVVITELAETLTTFIKFLTRNKAALIAFGVAISAVLVPAFIAWATSAAAAATATLAVASPVLIAVGAVLAIAAALRFAFNHFGPFHDAVIGVRDAAISLWQDVLVPLAKFLASTFVAAIKGLADIITGTIVFAVQTLVTVLTTLWHAVLEPIANVILFVLIKALQALAIILLGPIIIAVASVIAIMQALWHTVIEPLASVLIDVFMAAFQAVATFFTTVFNVAVAAVSTVLRTLWQTVLVPLANFLTSVFKTAISVVTVAWNTLWNNVLTPFGRFLQTVFNVALSVVKTAIGGVKAAVDGLIGVAKNIWHSVLEPFVKFLKATASPVINTFKAAFDGVTAAVRVARDVIRAIMGVIKDAIGLVGKLIKKIGDLPGAGLVGDITGGIGKVGDVLGLQSGAIIKKDTFAQLHSPEVVIPLNDARRALQLATNSGLLDLLGMTTGAKSIAGGTAPVTAGGAGVVINELNVSFSGPITTEQAQEGAEKFADALQTTLQERRLALSVRTI